jgi:hypothetical protein
MKINELVLKNRFVVEAGPVPPVQDTTAAPAATTTPAAPKPPAAPAAKGPGLWDQIKQGANKLQAGIAGAKAGYTSSQAQQVGQAEAEEIGSMYFKKWNSAIGQNPALNTAANLQAFMQNSTKKSGIKVPPPPAGELNPAVTSKYIIDVIGKSFAATDLGLPSERQDDTAPQQPEGPKFAPGVSITNDEPIMIKFKNTDYTLNDQGQWTPATAPNKLANQAMAAFLDKQHDIYLNSQPAATTPAATTPAATTPVATTPAATTPAATDTQTQQQVQPPVEKGYGDQSISPTEVNVNYKNKVDDLIKQAGTDTEKIKSLIAALQQGTPA